MFQVGQKASFDVSEYTGGVSNLVTGIVEEMKHAGQFLYIVCESLPGHGFWVHVSKAKRAI